MLYPVLVTFLAENKDYTITLVTKSVYARLFKNIERLIIYPIDFDNEFQGVIGLFKLSQNLLKGFSFDNVLDAHTVLRTRIINFFLTIGGKKIIRLKKYRTERRKLTRKNNKKLKPVPHAIDRYISIFNKAGFEFTIKAKKFLPDDSNTDSNPTIEVFENRGDKLCIGIAPFAKWNTKIWPLSRMEKLIEKLNNSGKYLIFLFGAGNGEKQQITSWEDKFANVYSVFSLGDLYNEIRFMSKLDLFLSMDSANMHLAALGGIPVFSIWGPTHSLAGFSSVNQPEENQIEIPAENLDCRPCSVFGEKKCWRGDHACMEQISVDKVFKKIDNFKKTATP